MVIISRLPVARSLPGVWGVTSGCEVTSGSLGVTSGCEVTSGGTITSGSLGTSYRILRSDWSKRGHVTKL